MRQAAGRMLRFAGPVVLSLAVVLLLTPGAWAAGAASAPQGQLAFVRDGSIWIAGVDGSNQQQLTTSSNGSQPAWSPDGRQIAFLRGAHQLWVMNADGSHARRVPFPIGLKQMPGTSHKETSYYLFAVTWLPSGSDLVVAANAFSGYPDDAAGIDKTQLFLVHPDGSHQRRIGPLIQGSPFRVSCSPSGSRIALTLYYNMDYSKVWILNRATRRYTDPFPNDALEYAAWSPDGASLACGRSDDQDYLIGPAHLVTMDVATGAETDLVAVDDGDPEMPPTIWASWSSDGAWLAFSTPDGSYSSSPVNTEIVSVADKTSSLAIDNADQPAWRPTHPLVVLIGGLSAKVHSEAVDPSGGVWKLIKNRLELAGYKVYVAACWPNARAGQNPDVINSESGNWAASAARLDHQLQQEGFGGQPVILVGHSMGGLIARVYAQRWMDLRSGCRPLGIVELGTPNKGAKAARLLAIFDSSDAVHKLANMRFMASFNAAYPNKAGLPIYRIAGDYFPKFAHSFSETHPYLKPIWDAIVLTYGSDYNDSVVTVDSVRGGPKAGWRGCAVFVTVQSVRAGSG